jgi:hypothetical protein
MQKKLRRKSAVFCAVLCKKLTQLTDQEWQCEFPLDGTSGRVDVGLRQVDGKYVLIEIELRRRLPAHNVLKTWFWASKQDVPPPFRLIHVLSSYYKTKPTFLDQTDFLAHQMESALKDAHYKRIESDFSPMKGTFGIGGAGKNRAEIVAEKIVAYLKTEGLLKKKSKAAAASARGGPFKPGVGLSG